MSGKSNSSENQITPCSQDPDPPSSRLREVELRQLDPETRESRLLKCLCIVHRIRPLHDTLLSICYHYKVSKRELRNLNGFSGDDIFFLKEILIPVKGAKPEETMQSLKSETKVVDEQDRKKNSIRLLADAIKLTESKHLRKLRQCRKHLDLSALLKTDFTAEAKFYLE